MNHPRPRTADAGRTRTGRSAWHGSARTTTARRRRWTRRSSPPRTPPSRPPRAGAAGWRSPASRPAWSLAWAWLRLLALVARRGLAVAPRARPARAPRGEADDMGYVSAEMIQREPPPAPPAPPPAQSAAVPSRQPRRWHAAPRPPPAKALSAPPAEVRQQASAPISRNDAAPEPSANAAAEPYLDEAVVDAPAPAAPAGYVRARAPRAATAPAAATVMASPAAPDSDFVPAPPASAPPAPSARHGEARRPPPPKAKPRRVPRRIRRATLAAKQSSQLDRIEVTGTRLALADVPVREDARLPIEDWLQRIRERRDDGDLDGARASLMLFRREHPASPRSRRPARLAARAEAMSDTLAATDLAPARGQAQPLPRPCRAGDHAGSGAGVPRRGRATRPPRTTAGPIASAASTASATMANPPAPPGRPILAAIDGQGCDQVVAVVTRWYGGIKLGAGGLVRAYGGAAAECLRARATPYR